MKKYNTIIILTGILVILMIPTSNSTISYAAATVKINYLSAEQVWIPTINYIDRPEPIIIKADIPLPIGGSQELTDTEVVADSIKIEDYSIKIKTNPYDDHFEGNNTISLKTMKIILKDSPALLEAENIYNEFKNEHMDVVIGLAYFNHESNYGLAGIARYSRSFGNIILTSNYIGKGISKASNDNKLDWCTKTNGSYCMRYYDSYTDGAKDWIQLMKYSNLYINDGLDTVTKATKRYAPSSDGNSEAGYISNVKNFAAEWRNFESNKIR